MILILPLLIPHFSVNLLVAVLPPRQSLEEMVVQLEGVDSIFIANVKAKASQHMQKEWTIGVDHSLLML